MFGFGSRSAIGFTPFAVIALVGRSIPANGRPGSSIIAIGGGTTIGLIICALLSIMRMGKILLAAVDLVYPLASGSTQLAILMQRSS